MLFQATTKVTRLRRQPLPDYRLAPWADPAHPPAEDTVNVISIYPTSSSEVDTPGRTQAQGDYTMMAPPDLDIKPGDRIRDAAGRLFEVTGAITCPWTSPFTGWTPGKEIPLREVKG